MPLTPIQPASGKSLKTTPLLVTIAILTIAALVILRNQSTRHTAEMRQARTEFDTRRTATSSIRTYIDANGDEVVETVNSQYKHKEIWLHGDSRNPSNYRIGTFLETVDTKHTLGLDQYDSTTSVDAWIGDTPATQTKVWSINQQGEAGRIDEQLYCVERLGEVDLMPVYTFYSLITGKQLYQSTQEKLTEIDIPNTGYNFIRYASIHETESILRDDAEAGRRQVIGVFRYGSADRVISRLVIQYSADPAKVDFGGRPLTLQTRYQGKLSSAGDLDLWGVDGKASTHSLTDFSIVISSGRNASHPAGNDIDIPIVDDKPDLTHARIPTGVTLTAG
jgi:type II secretory pathway pseudopilin PulG